MERMAKKDRTRKKFNSAGVGRNAAKQSRGSQYGYLNLPKGTPIFKEEPDTRVTLDIMPYEVTIENHPDRDDDIGIALPGELWYKRPYLVHRNIGPENHSIVCPTSIGQKCPICEYRAQLIKEGKKYDDESVRALKPSKRNLYIVIPRGSKKFEEIPHIWDIAQSNFQAQLNEEIEENEANQSFPDLEEGKSLRIRFGEKSFGSNKFAQTSRIDFRDREKPYEDSILDDIPHLDDVLEIPSYKAVEAMFFGGLDEDSVKEEEEEEKPRRSHRSAPPPESDNDDDSDDDEEEEEEEEKPRRGKGKKEEEEDSDDEDSDDDEEEEEKEPEKEPEAPKPPTRRTRKNIDTPPATEKGKCPHGHRFGKDVDEYDECEKCKNWEACMDASE
jgi:hypothetical protein